MSQKAWMNAYTKGSKEMQARLAKVHAKNPEFQAFIAQHGFGGNLSVKQSGLQKKSSVATVKPVTEPHPESNKNASREAVIKAAAEKLRNRRLASGNRAAFGGELGGGFSMPMSGFRTYRESVNEQSEKRLEKYIKKATKSADRLAYYSDSRNDPDWIKSNKREKMIAVARKRIQATDESVANADSKGKKYFSTTTGKADMLAHKEYMTNKHFKDASKENLPYKKNLIKQSLKSLQKEEVPYKDAVLTMRKGGWIVKRDGKQQGVIHPTEELAKRFADNTRKTLAHKLGDVLRRKAKEIAKGMGRQSLAVESEANRNRVMAYDSAVTSSPVALKVKPKKTITGKMKSYFRRTFKMGVKSLKTEGQDPKVLALRAAGKHEEARKLERAALAKGFAAAKRDTLNKPGEKRKPDQEQLRIDSRNWHNGD